jgi:hypothetical protein
VGILTLRSQPDPRQKQNYAANKPPLLSLLPWPHVQFRQAQNGRRLDHSHPRRHRRYISRLVDAPGVRAVNPLKTFPTGVDHPVMFSRQEIP